MKANELRIRNKVYHTHFFVRTISSIRTNSTDIPLVRFEKSGGEYSINDILPITLTEEILLKCRFSMKYGTDPQEQNALKVFNLENLEILKFELDKFFFFSTGKGLIHTNIKYLHQLQNLYFALTGQELEINL